MFTWAHRSAVDRFLGMEEGRGSNPLESISIKVHCYRNVFIL